MSKIFLVISFILFNIYIAECALCPSGWKKNSDRCYYVSSIKTNYTNASIDCASMNSYLAIPNSADEAKYLKNELTSSTVLYFYVGLYDYGDKDFQSTDGSVAYLSWCPSEPNNGALGNVTEPCGVVKSCGLNDGPCTNKYYYVCEKASCSSYQHYDEAKGTCEDGRTYNDVCSIDSDCDSRLNLVCSNITNKCSCDTNLLWEDSTCKLCPTGWESYKTSCYFFSTGLYPYTTAADKCKDKGYSSYVAIPNSSEEFSFLNSTKVSGNAYNVGIYDWKNKNFIARDNSTAYYSWCSGEPNKGLKGSPVEACVTLKDCGLNDSSCTSNNYYICEFNK